MLLLALAIKSCTKLCTGAQIFPQMRNDISVQDKLVFSPDVEPDSALVL